jgi:tetratricopeptide (TPR) repeat protein
MKPPLGLAFLVAATAAVAPLAASAADDVEQAKALFNAGAQAYAATRYQDAVHSFQAAYRKAPRPAILFSLAQAYRRLYVIDPKPESLKAAIANYRRYLAEVPQGGRRADATEALSELEVVAARLDVHAPAAAPAEPEVAVEVKPRTRINVTSPTAGARVSLDGGAPVDVPLMAEVQPGKHTIKLTADGFADEERATSRASIGSCGSGRRASRSPPLKAPRSCSTGASSARRRCRSSRWRPGGASSLSR